MIAIDFTRRIILIGNSSYAGEMKKSVFTTLNFYLPAQGVMPMHCSANVGKDGDSRAVLRPVRHRQDHALGRSQPHADRRRRDRLVRPTASSISRAAATPRCIKLSAEAEPQIWDATNRFGAVLENVVFDPETRVPDYDNDSKTENTRSAYPLDFIPNASRTGRAGHPKNIIFLTADAYGVMPPIAKLTPAQAMYHFLSGYTAKVAGTEKGLVGVEPEFSTCFGAPFLPRPPAEYGNLLRDYIARHKVDCWLVNSGWTGGIYGVGRRMPIKVTRALVTGALDGSLRNCELPHRSVFRLRGADLGAGHRAAPALSDEDLEGQSRVRRDRAQARRHVPEELRQVREATSTPRCVPPRPKFASPRSSIRLARPREGGDPAQKGLDFPLARE